MAEWRRVDGKCRCGPEKSSSVVDIRQIVALFRNSAYSFSMSSPIRISAVASFGSQLQSLLLSLFLVR